MRDRSFYVTLVSNTPGVGNNSAVFTTQLSEALHLNSSEWEVGLHEVIIPASYAIRRENWFFKVKYGDGREVSFNADNTSIVSNQTTIDDLNRLTKDVVFEYSVTTTLATIRLEKSVREIELSKELAYYLGFPTHPMSARENVALYQVDHRNNHSSIYIYTDIVEANHVGHTKTSLLRTLPASDQNKFGMIYKTFEIPRYVNLNHNVVQSIKIEILDEFGRPLKFHFGHSIIVLHFKTRY